MSLVKRVWPGLIACSLLLAQQPSQSAPQSAEAPLILKATTRLVMLSVVARDKNGQPDSPI